MPALVRELCLRRVDLLCTHGYKADILGLLAGWVTGIPVACFLRGWTCENVRIRFFEAIDRLALPFARRIVCLSEHQAIRLRKWPLLASRIRIVSNAINLPHFPPERIASTRELLRRQFDLPSDCLVIASGGRLSPEKGVRVFLEAAQLILGRYSNVYFLVFGEGPLREELELESKRIGLGDRLVFAGFVPVLREFLPGLDILVNPSFSEEMPNIVLEGMAAEIPVVATAVGGVPEISGDDHAISLVPPGDPKSIAEAVSLIVGNPTNARQLAARGRARVQQVYSHARQRAQLHALYRELLLTPETEIKPADLPTAQFDHREILRQKTKKSKRGFLHLGS